MWLEIARHANMEKTGSELRKPEFSLDNYQVIAMRFLEANLGEPHFALLQNGIAVKIMYEIFSREFDPE